ncbi:PEP-CTERM sorting domain-containing protein [Actibacterium ureilyticum]|uniref:PEP-CTERM sorting domain-containing protein n=1 Tax=Actibacterium ureilyticum TaxID=1590614 RepID=UPI000BAADBD6|nr:PEP-CTERM sorting domain-containing protein [Actibacterium ureilyticum]
MKRTMNISGGLAALCLGFAALVTPAAAAVVQSTGTGSSVTRTDATATFDDTASLGGQFTEDGMTFTRVNLSTNNNGCGYAGCASSFPTFSGNYLYGYGNGHLSIAAAQDRIFEGLEFNFGWSTNHNITWEAFLEGDSVDRGRSRDVAGGTVLSFSGLFDTLLFTSNHIFNNPRLNGRFNAPAIDTVRAQYLPSVVPVPATLPLLLSALLGGGWLLRRKRA